MHKGDRIFVDGLASVKMTNGVVLFDFYNEQGEEGNSTRESCGEIVMSQQAFLQAYGAMEDLLKKMIDAGIVRRNSNAQIAGSAGPDESNSPNFS